MVQSPSQIDSTPSEHNVRPYSSVLTGDLDTDDTCTRHCNRCCNGQWAREGSYIWLMLIAQVASVIGMGI